MDILSLISPSAISSLLVWKTVAAHIILAFFVACFFIRHSIARRVVSWVGTYALPLSFIVAVGGTNGSLLYSEVVGFEPCFLCTVQRLFLFPQVILLFLGIVWRDVRILSYTAVLSVVGGIVALYHSYTQLGGGSLLPCTSEGGECAKVLVLEFGYITIPTMSLTVFLALLTIYIAFRVTTRNYQTVKSL